MISLFKLGLLAGSVLLLSLIYLIVQRVIHKDDDKQRKSVFRKLTRILYFVLLIVIVSLALGYDVSNVWVGLASVVGLVAIGFVAVWSMLGNIFAGVIIFASKPFKIDQKIKMVDSGTTGIVDDITMFYTVL